MQTSTTPGISGIDHIHVYVKDRGAAEKWYATVLGYRRVSAFESWASKEGPLTIENSEGNVHLALFERDREVSDSAIAFKASGKEFARWVAHLRAHNVDVSIKDHDLAVSLYFEDLDGNLLEITTYDHAEQNLTFLSSM